MPRLLRTRWWLVLGLALLNAWIAGYLTDLRNQERPEWEAVGAITYVPRLGEVDDDPVLERLRADLEAALATNEEELGSRNGLFGWEVAAIEAEETSHRLVFVGRADEPSAAEDIAEELRQRFVDGGYLETALLGELDTQLDLILEELGTLQQRIGEATAVEPPDPEIELQRTLLTAEREALTGRYASLSAQLLAPTEDRSVESIEEELDLIQSRLRQVRAELTSLPPPLDAEAADEVPPEESLPTTIDSLQYEQLQVVYQELFLRRLEAQAGGTVQPIRLQPTTLQPIPKTFNQAIGALVGAVAALLGVVMVDRMRGPIWAGIAMDDTVVLQVIPPRPLFASGGRPWYLRSPPNERKAGIQKLRSVVEVLNQDKGATVGISGISLAPQDVHELAADLAVSLAVSGRRVLFVDANLDHPGHLVEFGHDQISLSEVLRFPIDGGNDVRHEIKTLLWESTEVIPNLRSLPAGMHQLDAADMLSRPEFGALLETAREMFDMVVVSGADASDPSAHVLTQRLEAMLLVGTAGQTTTSAVMSTTRSLADRRARLLGLVVLSRPPGLLGRVIRSFRGRARRRRQRAARPETSLHLRPLPSASDASSSQTRDRPAVGNAGPDSSE